MRVTINGKTFAVRRRDGKFRIVRLDNGQPRIARNPDGGPKDGGGHATRAGALGQLTAMQKAAQN